MNLLHMRHRAISSSTADSCKVKECLRSSCDCAVILASQCYRLGMQQRRTRPSVVLDVWWIHTREVSLEKKKRVFPAATTFAISLCFQMWWWRGNCGKGVKKNCVMPKQVWNLTCGSEKEKTCSERLLMPDGHLWYWFVRFFLLRNTGWWN